MIVSIFSFKPQECRSIVFFTGYQYLLHMAQGDEGGADGIGETRRDVARGAGEIIASDRAQPALQPSDPRSRLGCQVHMTKELDGMVAKLPSATRNMYVDGAKARTH